MPKIIKDCHDKILESAKEELQNEEKSGFSMRRVAKKAGVAVGTIYHYYPDKINLIASILLSSWMEQYQKAIDKVSFCSSLEGVLKLISDLIDGFKKENQNTFLIHKNEGFSEYYTKLHTSFCKQIEELLKKGLQALGYSSTEEEAEMISEMILIQSRSKGISFNTLVSMISIILKEENHEKQL